uniref:Uncharacterized protein n=1 Tax=Lepeophtheirus salmonis TaxID=72036 RepID=A0A0K2V9S6_LEPSM
MFKKGVGRVQGIGKCAVQANGDFIN